MYDARKIGFVAELLHVSFTPTDLKPILSAASLIPNNETPSRVIWQRSRRFCRE